MKSAHHVRRASSLARIEERQRQATARIPVVFEPNSPVAAAGWTTGDVSGLLEATALLHEAERVDQFPEQMLAALRRIVPFEVGECYIVDRDHQIVSACARPDRPIPLPRRDEFQRLARLHPLNALLCRHPGRAFVLSDVLPLEVFVTTDFYRLLYWPRRVNRELVAVLPESCATGDAGDAGDESGAGGFLRVSLRRWGPEFTEPERARMNLMLPAIQRARRRLQARSKPVEQEPPAGVDLPDEAAFFSWVRSAGGWPLTRRESDVVYWLAQGKTNAEIGRILGMAERTAETHALRAYPKIGVENRHGAIASITRRSLLTPRPATRPGSISGAPA